jgi:hypothetical protein
MSRQSCRCCWQGCTAMGDGLLVRYGQLVCLVVDDCQRGPRGAERRSGHCCSAVDVGMTEGCHWRGSTLTVLCNTCDIDITITIKIIITSPPSPQPPHRIPMGRQLTQDKQADRRNEEEPQQ